MPQVRDPKTGRYTSGGGSSVGGAAGTNSRVQKAKAVGGGATAGGVSTTKSKSSGPKVDEEMQPVSDGLHSKLDGLESPYGDGKIKISSPNEYAVTVEIGGQVWDKVYQVRTDEFRWESQGSYKASFKTAKEATNAVVKSYADEGFL